MSGYILCQTKKADKPFFVESINTNIYSLEELCYFLYHNLYLVDSSVINENLCIWISEELDLPRLAAKLRPHLGKFASAEDVLYPVFKEINYLTYDELKALNVKLAKLDQEAPLLRKKRKGDALVANKMYVSAIKVYQQLLKKEGLELIRPGLTMSGITLDVRTAIFFRWRKQWSVSGRRFLPRAILRSWFAICLLIVA